MQYQHSLSASELPVKSSPWGKPDGGYYIAEGITKIFTPSHGGLHLSRTRQRHMPDYFKAVCADGAFYEEDCNWCVVALAYPGEFSSDDVKTAQRTLRNWFPDLYERHYGVTLTPGESSKRDEETFARESAHNYTVRSAWGDWEETTPEGYVSVYAVRQADGAERYFLIPKAEYVKPARLICDGYPVRNAPTGRSRPRTA